jgi:ribosomal protein L12E/L44/L45/RPP1/RPP2
MAREPLASERDLWRIWEQRRLPISLTTRDGRVLRVLFPGVANAEPGPDYRGALLALDSDPPVRGDVELHIKATSWEGHGHHHDTRYDTVILHVVLFDDGGPAHTSAGLPIPLLAVGPLLEALEGPARPVPEPGPCYSPHAARKPVNGIKEILREAGRERFEGRVSTWQGEIAATCIEDAVLHALLRAAGLGRNREACAALATALDGRTLDAALLAARARGPAVAAASLLGMAGLLDAAHADAEMRETWNGYRHYWPGQPLEARQWQRFRLRPANLPENRLLLVAGIVARHGLAGFIEAFGQAFAGGAVPSSASLLALLAPPRATLGRGWGLEALVNTVFPLVAAHARLQGDDAIANRVAACYAALPGGGDNSKLERMTCIAGLAKTPRDALAQQGMLHLWATYCSGLRCGACPLAATQS